jgi:beta-glucosidase
LDKVIKIIDSQVEKIVSKKISKREIKNRSLAREVAAEGIVLLKNDNALPINVGKVALYGPGSRKTVKGGSGSGDVHERHSVTIEEGLKNAGFAFPTTLWMDRFVEKYNTDVALWRAEVEGKIKGYGPIQTMQMFNVIHEHPMPYPACTPILHDELTNECDTAIYVLSRQAGEGKDRRVEKGDYLLSDLEEESLKILSRHYKKLILVLNCGGVIDLSILDKVRIDAVIFYGQGGMEGGNALADILTGKVNPSGRLTDTWARNYEDYPSANTFGHRNGDLENEEYSEGIYIGYRWFDKNEIKPRYEFGFGLTYSEITETWTDENTVILENKGDFDVNYSVLKFEYIPHKNLCGFKKVSIKKGETVAVKF